jgi:hypothetical protein
MRSIVADNHQRPASLLEKGRQFTSDPAAGEWRSENGCLTLVSNVIVDVQNPEPPPIGNLVMHEVE